MKKEKDRKKLASFDLDKGIILLNIKRECVQISIAHQISLINQRRHNLKKQRRV